MFQKYKIIDANAKHSIFLESVHLQSSKRVLIHKLPHPQSQPLVNAIARQAHNPHAIKITEHYQSQHAFFVVLQDAYPLVEAVKAMSFRKMIQVFLQLLKLSRSREALVPSELFMQNDILKTYCLGGLGEAETVLLQPPESLNRPALTQQKEAFYVWKLGMAYLSCLVVGTKENDYYKNYNQTLQRIDELVVSTPKLEAVLHLVKCMVKCSPYERVSWNIVEHSLLIILERHSLNLPQQHTSKHKSFHQARLKVGKSSLEQHFLKHILNQKNSPNILNDKGLCRTKQNRQSFISKSPSNHRRLKSSKSGINILSGNFVSPQAKNSSLLKESGSSFKTTNFKELMSAKSKKEERQVPVKSFLEIIEERRKKKKETQSFVIKNEAVGELLNLTTYTGCVTPMDSGSSAPETSMLVDGLAQSSFSNTNTSSGIWKLLKQDQFQQGPPKQVPNNLWMKEAGGFSKVLLDTSELLNQSSMAGEYKPKSVSKYPKEGHLTRQEPDDTVEELFQLSARPNNFPRMNRNKQPFKQNKRIHTPPNERVATAPSSNEEQPTRLSFQRVDKEKKEEDKEMKQEENEMKQDEKEKKEEENEKKEEDKEKGKEEPKEGRRSKRNSFKEHRTNRSIIDQIKQQQDPSVLKESFSKILENNESTFPNLRVSQPVTFERKTTNPPPQSGKDVSKEQISQPSLIPVKDHKKMLKALNILGETVKHANLNLRSQRSKWMIPCFLIYKCYWSFRLGAIEFLKDKIKPDNIDSFLKDNESINVGFKSMHTAVSRTHQNDQAFRVSKDLLNIDPLQDGWKKRFLSVLIPYFQHMNDVMAKERVHLVSKNKFKTVIKFVVLIGASILVINEYEGEWEEFDVVDSYTLLMTRLAGSEDSDIIPESFTQGLLFKISKILVQNS